MADLSDRAAALSPKQRALLAQRLRAEVKVGAPPPIPRREGAGPVRLSFAQERLWLLDRLEPGSPGYNLLDAIELSGRLDAATLAAALAEVVRRHESLRTVFVEHEGVPLQVVGPPPAALLPVIDLSRLPEPARRSTARALAVAEGRIPFDLARGPLFRASLLRLGKEDHLLVLVMHHIVADLWSFGVLVRELGALYAGTPLPDLEIQYADFAVWQRGWLAGETLEKQLDHWQRQLAGAPVVFELPADRPRPPAQSHRGALFPFTLPSALVGTIRGLAQEAGGTPFMVCLAAFATLLSRWSGADDLLVGSPIAGRTRRELEPLLGLFVNTLVLRTGLAGDPTFLELLARVRETTLGALAHQDLPFERLVEELKPERDPSRSPLVQILFAFQNAPVQRLGLPGLTFNPLDLDTDTAKLDLSLFLTEGEGGIAGAVEYSTDLFDEARIQRLAGHLRQLLQGASQDPGRRLSELPLLTEAERQQLAGWNRTEAAYPQDLCLHQLFEAQVERSPETVAVRCEERSLTYRELDRRASRLACWLQANGVGPEGVVGVLLDRSLEMVEALLGVLKAGGAYLPLDPSSPRDRLGFCVADAAPAVVLTTSGLAGLLPPGGRALCLDTEGEALGGSGDARPQVLAGPESLAYVIYTSGSTGRPKGAMNAHRGIVNRIVWMQEAYGLDAGDRVLQKTPFTFDVSVWEFFWPLLVGARLVMARPGGHRDPAYLVDAIAREGITTLHFVPSMLRAFLEAGDLDRCRSLRRVLASGEELPADLAARFFDRLGWAELHNLYGPTEAAVDVTAWPCRRETVRSGVPIGRPIANLRIHLVDRGGQPVPVGVPGELLIGGVGVGRGYLARPGLTAERFLPDPWSPDPGRRLYRTGDLARYRPDGAIEFLGRLDHQVKIRGFRVELGEIEAALTDLAEVGAAVVLARDYGPGDRRLVACVVPAEGAEFSPELLRDALREVLPEPLIPAVFVALSELPLNPNGKVDRRALASLAADGPSGERPYTPPGSAVEEALAEIWADLLKVERVGIHDNFFDLGGHSLLAHQLTVRVRDGFGIDVPLRSVFEAPTIARFAEAVLARQVELQDEDELERLLAELEELPDERAREELARD